MRQAGKPKEVNFDGEFDVPQFIRFLSSGGVSHRVSENRQDLGVLDASMGALKKDLKRTCKCKVQTSGESVWARLCGV